MAKSHHLAIAEKGEKLGDSVQKMSKSGSVVLWRNVEERRRSRAWHLFCLFAVITVILIGRLVWLTHQARQAPGAEPVFKTRKFTEKTRKHMEFFSD